MRQESIEAAIERPSWLVRIRLTIDTAPVGAGMLCPDGHVITCAHVVSTSSTRRRPSYPLQPASTVYVEFQHVAHEQPIPAQIVTEGGWYPPESEDDRTGDIAVLALQASPPAQAAPAPLCSTKAGVRDHHFHAYGYPKFHEKDGVPSRGTIVGHAGTEWLQLEARSSLGQALEAGFSGSPVWDIELRAVIGIVVLHDVPSERRDPRTGYAIPCEVLARYWTPLAKHLDVVSGADSTAAAEHLESLLEISLAADSSLPKVTDVNIYDIGVSMSKAVDPDHPSPPYVPRRRIDAELDDALTRKSFILAVGDSKSGKSRTMIELLRRQLPNARLIVPISDPPALVHLTRAHLPIGTDPAVLWLDDLDRYLGPNGLDHKILAHFAGHTPPIVVLGTMTSKRHGALLDTTDAANRTARGILNKAAVVRVPSTLSAEDRTEAERLYPGEDFHERGIGEQLVAAPALEQRYDNGREMCPEGWAVLQAAIDWRRMGLQVPVPDSVIRAIFAHYLAMVSTDQDATDELLAAGLRWARQSVAGHVALLSTADPRDPAGGRSYRAFEYIVAYADGQRPGTDPVSIPEFMWDYAVESLRGEDLLVLAFGALTRGRGTLARRAAKAAHSSSEDSELTARAALVLGDLESEAGNVVEAQRFLEEAVASGLDDIVPIAQTDLGGLLALPGGDSERARVLLEAALKSNTTEIEPIAKLNLGVLLMNRGDIAAARPLLEAALASQDPGVTPRAQAHFSGLLAEQEEAERNRAPHKEAPDLGRKPSQPVRSSGSGRQRNSQLSRLMQQAMTESRATQVVPFVQASLGGLLVGEGELDRARVLLEAALESGNARVAPLAQTNLGGLLLHHGDLAGAQAQFEAALLAGNSLVTPFAQVGLGWVLAQGSDVTRGRQLLESAAASNNIDQAARAECLLGDLQAQENDLDAAASSYRRALSSGNRQWAPYAQVGLGTVIGRRGDLEGARQQLEPVIDSGHPELAPRAADLLGDLLAAAGDVEAAEAVYRRAVSSGHRMWGPIATGDLATLLFRTGRVTQAEELLEGVASGDDALFAPLASITQGDMRFELGDIEGARSAYLTAITSQHPEAAPDAQVRLGQMLASCGDVEAARELFEQASNGMNVVQAARAADLLGDLLTEHDPEGAAAAYQRAIDSGDPQWSATARVDLAQLLLTESENIDAAEPLLATAAESSFPLASARARLLIGVIRLFQGQPEAASEQFRLAEASGPPGIVSEARLQMARLAFESGELDRAAELLEGLIDGSADDSGLVAYATAYLGAVRLRQGNTEAALPLLDLAEDSGHAGAAGFAFLHQGTQMFEINEIEAAGELLTAALDTGDADVEPEAQAVLGMVRLAQDRLDDARELLQAALDSGEPAVEPKARRYLASALARLGRQAEAREHLVALAALPDQVHRPEGLLLLGQLAALDGDTEQGRRWLAEAIGSGDLDVEAKARVELSELLAKQGDRSGVREVLSPISSAPGEVGQEAQSILGQVETTTAVPTTANIEYALSASEAAAEKLLPSQPLRELPSRILALLGEVAAAEGQAEEAEYWMSRSTSRADPSSA